MCRTQNRTDVCGGCPATPRGTQPRSRWRLVTSQAERSFPGTCSHEDSRADPPPLFPELTDLSGAARSLFSES